jgi:hypothetical protein
MLVRFRLLCPFQDIMHISTSVYIKRSSCISIRVTANRMIFFHCMLGQRAVLLPLDGLRRIVVGLSLRYKGSKELRVFLQQWSR